MAKILYDDQGLTRVVSLENESLSSSAITWGEVTSVSAFKRDLFAFDLICMVIRAGTIALEVDEQMEGWKDAIQALPRYLPGMPGPSEWWDTVAHPAFALNETLLFTAE